MIPTKLTSKGGWHHASKFPGVEIVLFPRTKNVVFLEHHAKIFRKKMRVVSGSFALETKIQETNKHYLPPIPNGLILHTPHRKYIKYRIYILYEKNNTHLNMNARHRATSSLTGTRCVARGCHPPTAEKWHRSHLRDG